MLRSENLMLTYQDGDQELHAVNDVSITISDYKFIGILGPSGSGKSSLLYLLSGLRKPTSGEVYFDDRAYGKMSERDRVKMRRTEFGFIFQQHFLINYMTVLENVMVAAIKQDKSHADQARALLENLGIGDKLHRFPHELSGGQRQRVAVARAAIHRPRVVFADEPTGLLDRHTGMQVTSLMRSVSEHGSLIAVTHNPEILADADLIIKMRDGRIQSVEDSVTRKAAGGIAEVPTSGGAMSQSTMAVTA